MTDQQIVFFGSAGREGENTLWAIRRKDFLQIGNIFPARGSECVVIQKDYGFFVLPEALETIQARWDKNKEELVINLTHLPEVPAGHLAKAPVSKPTVAG